MVGDGFVHVGQDVPLVAEFKKDGEPVSGLTVMAQVVSNLSATELLATISLLEAPLFAGWYEGKYTVPDNTDYLFVRISTDGDVDVKSYPLLWVVGSGELFKLTGNVGIHQIDISITDTLSGDPIADVQFSILKNGQLITFGMTDFVGAARIFLDASEYTIQLRKTGVSFEQGALVVDGPGAFSFTGIVPVSSNPVPAGQCEVYEQIRVENPDHIPDVSKAKAKIIEVPYEIGGDFYSKETIPAEYDSSTGEITWRFVFGAKVSFNLTSLYGVKGTATIPESERIRLKDLLGI